MFINHGLQEINLKIVFYGPGLGGKTTNLEHIYKQLDPTVRSDLVTLKTKEERTLYFDFMQLELGRVKGFKPRFNLYTVPGQVFYEASRKLILRGVDGVVFVADSQPERMDANFESLENLGDNLKEYGYDFNEMPYVLQLNKRDLPNVMSGEDMNKALQKKTEPALEAVAVTGAGVFETLREVSKQVLAKLKKG